MSHPVPPPSPPSASLHELLSLSHRADKRKTISHSRFCPLSPQSVLFRAQSLETIRRLWKPSRHLQVWKTWRLFPRLHGASSCRRRRCNPVLAARKAGSLHSHSTRAACPPVRERKKQRHTVIILSLKYTKPRRFFFSVMWIWRRPPFQSKNPYSYSWFVCIKGRRWIPCRNPPCSWSISHLLNFPSDLPIHSKRAGGSIFPHPWFPMSLSWCWQRVALKWEGGETKSLHNPYHCLQQWLKD